MRVSRIAEPRTIRDLMMLVMASALRSSVVSCVAENYANNREAIDR